IIYILKISVFVFKNASFQVLVRHGRIGYFYWCKIIARIDGHVFPNLSQVLFERQGGCICFIPFSSNKIWIGYIPDLGKLGSIGYLIFPHPGQVCGFIVSKCELPIYSNQLPCSFHTYIVQISHTRWIAGIIVNEIHFYCFSSGRDFTFKLAGSQQNTPGECRKNKRIQSGAVNGHRQRSSAFRSRRSLDDHFHRLTSNYIWKTEFIILFSIDIKSVTEPFSTHFGGVFLVLLVELIFVESRNNVVGGIGWFNHLGHPFARPTAVGNIIVGIVAIWV